ncbi:hypothetical protein [Actinacidiphila oryziradicis]|uniref:Uncharacterized protein n=1 Tax=Actinacidiphila oryziradicis TaxID=2571141 RepID=A0A4U0SIU3_9ACTN|nr:hypothetical protein [Actinacidiphila oryziradicis]TKA09512.1 hypothetical protein FCI23_21955 [Actinacidiphila oryziradicis]
MEDDYSHGHADGVPEPQHETAPPGPSAPPASEYEHSGTGDESPETVEAEKPEDSDEDLPALPYGLPALPKTAAVRKLAGALVSYGYSEGAATAVARAIARPEEARKRLQNPDIMRVPGGVLETITTQVWLPSVSHFPGNNREAGHRTYPLSGELQPGSYPPLRGLEATPGETGELVLTAQSRAHVVSALDQSNAFLARHNDLEETIGQHGILRELLLTVIRINHTNGEDPAWTLSGADGSSRISAGHRIHGLGASDVVYALATEDRKYRGLLSEVLASTQKSRDELGPEDVKRAQALVAPATFILRFRPDTRSILRFDQAIRFIVGITHVEPPKPWGMASENDALADPVIEEFLAARRINQSQAEWFAADLSPDQVQARGLDPNPDTRVAEIVGRILPKTEHDVFRKGVLRITAKGKVTSDFKAKVVTEMVLRPWRSAHPDADGVDRVSGARSTLQRMLKWPILQESGWRRGGDNDPDKMLEVALKDLSTDGSSGAAGVELGVRGGYYLAVHGSLVREARGRTQDYRAPSSVVQRMTESPQGLRALHRAILDGRQGNEPQQVDKSGSLRYNVRGEPLAATDDWLRTTFPALGENVPAAPIEGTVDTPEARFEQSKSHFASMVASLENAIRAAEAVQGRSRPLVKERGWPQVHAEDLAARLDKISGRLKMYAAIAEVADEAYPGEDDPDETAGGETDQG